MTVTRDQINDAIARFKDRGGSIKRIDRIVGEPVFGNEFLITEDTLELIETKESDFLG
tara:strand:- start:2639 stop:2812 length:174 start_codon:yes stop_codon:yes gene_type:complete